MNIFNDIARNKFLIWTFSVYDFRCQYLGSALGFFWSMIKPLVMAGIYVLIFSSVVPPENSSIGESPFGLYVFAGMLPWFVIQESVQRSSTVLIDHAHLVRHHTLPLYILPLHIVLSATVSGLSAIVVFMIVKSFFIFKFSFVSLLIVAILPMQILFCWGLTLIISTTNVFIRDVSHLTIAMLTVWFFASPIVFTVEGLPWFLTYPIVNPLVSITSIYRDIFLFQGIPAPSDILWFCFHTVVVMCLGAVLYQKTHRDIVDWV